MRAESSEQTGNNVTFLPEKRKKKKSEGIPKAVFYRAVTDSINGLNPLFPPFPANFITYAPDDVGTRLPISINDEGECRIVELKAVQQAIMQFTQTALVARPDYAWTAAECLACAEFWLAFTPPEQTEIATVRWQGEKGLTWRRLPWELRAGPTPTWDTLMGNLTNKRAVQDFIASMCLPKSYNQQYCWIRGGGGDGKSTLTDFLSRAFGQTYAAEEAPHADDKFWSHGLVGKRVVVFPDTRNTTFVTTGRFLALTGGDAIRVEIKNGPKFTYKHFAKFLILSQRKPKIGSDFADQRRLIFAELNGNFSKLKRADVMKFRDALWEEGGAFLSNCVIGYCTRNPELGPIDDDDKDTSADELQGWVSAVEEDFEEHFAENYQHRPDLEPQYWVSPAEMQLDLVSRWRDRTKQIEFIEWIDRKYKVRKKCCRLPDGKVIKRYAGLARRSKSH